MSIRFRDALTFAVALSSLSPCGTGAQEVGPYDVVILGGRVIDSETGFGLQYVPSTSEEEVFRMFEFGARYGVPSHRHIRYLGPQQPINSVVVVDNGELMESVHPGRAIRDAPGGS